MYLFSGSIAAEIGAGAVLWVVDRQVVKHTVEAGAALVEVPVRVRFEFGLAAERFVAGSLSRTFLYNRPELLRRFPGLDAEWLDQDVEQAVDRALMEYLKFRGYASGEVRLYPAPAPEGGDASAAHTPAGGFDDADGAPAEGDPGTHTAPAPRIIMPRG